MITIKTLPEFNQWLTNIKDRQTRIQLSRRLERVQLGKLGDINAVGEGVFEMREHFGPGWRMYYVQRGSEIIIMLGGGDKSSQATDISKAKRVAEALED
ncbi:MAG: type II toxin-antitoxin system RelE/ParE family toxin [Methylococcales bacterium]